MAERKRLTLDTVAGGVAPELFLHELEKVLANVRDVNTPAKKARSIVLRFDFHPREDRDHQRRTVDVTCAASSKLAPVNLATGRAFITKTADGLTATTDDVRQAELELEPGEELDKTTGEVKPPAAPPAGGTSSAPVEGVTPLHGPRAAAP